MSPRTARSLTPIKYTRDSHEPIFFIARVQIISAINVVTTLCPFIRLLADDNSRGMGVGGGFFFFPADFVLELHAIFANDYGVFIVMAARWPLTSDNLIKNFLGKKLVSGELATRCSNKKWQKAFSFVERSNPAPCNCIKINGEINGKLYPR